MSRNNIVSTSFDLEDMSVVLTFHCHGQPAIRSYKFYGGDAIAVATGADPKDLSGVEVNPSQSDFRKAFGRMSLGEAGAGEEAATGFIPMAESVIVESLGPIIEAAGMTI